MRLNAVEEKKHDKSARRLAICRYQITHVAPSQSFAPASSSGKVALDRLDPKLSFSSLSQTVEAQVRRHED